MPLTKIQFRPGVVNDLTSYTNEGGWNDGDKIRFRIGYPEKIGGWTKQSGNTYLGTTRDLHNWVALDQSDFLGVGTHLKYYIEEGGAFSDITPLRSTTSAGDVTFSASDGSAVITVTDTGHGALENDFVTFSGAASLGGNVTAAILNAEHQITNIVDSNSYTFTASATANSSDSGNGGSSVVGKYQLNVGLDSAVGGTGWGGGLWGGTVSGAAVSTLNEGGTLSASDTTITLTSAADFPAAGTILIESELITYTGKSTNNLTGCVRGALGTTAATHADGTAVTNATDFFGWGEAAPTGTNLELRHWSHDNFGEDLILNPRDSNIYYWDKTDGLVTRAVELSTRTGTKTSVPQIAKQIMVSDNDRHVIAFGCDSIGASSSDTQGDGVQDPLLIRFSDQENPLVWYPAVTNTAGELRLGSGSTFVQAVETKREILVFTDKSLHSMQFIGPPLVFGIQLLTANTTIMGPKAAIAAEDFVVWMGVDNFYIYSGQTAQMQCPVKTHVFEDFDFDQREKVVAGINSEFNEVWWFYPSNTGSGENDRYVVFNYGEKIWYYGTLNRTAWIDRGIRNNPIAAGENYLFLHENGVDDDGSAMTAFIESSAQDIGDGEQFMFIKRLIPDIKFTGSETSGASTTLTLKARNFPGQDYDFTDSGTVARTQTSPVDEHTNQLHVRLRGRSYSLRVESNTVGVKWKLGSPRLDARPDGRR